MKKNDLINNLRQYLCPPGAGVFTVNTAKEKKESLWLRLYEQKSNIENIWLKSLEVTIDDNKVIVLGICSDCGGGIQRGANWGPLYVREAILKYNDKLNYNDIGDIRVIPHLLHDKYLNDETLKSCKEALYLNKDSALPVSPLSISKKCYDDLLEYNKDHKIFTIGGDHSVSYPIVKSYLENKKLDNKKVAIIHFDAHTDLLRTRLGIDLCFGSWLTHVLDDLDSPDLCYQLGIRSSGKDKKHWENEFGLNQYWAQEILDIGPFELSQIIIKDLKAKKVDELYVSFDIDALDESVASATGTPEAGGLFPHDCIIILKELERSFKITGADMVEVAPNVGNDKLNQLKTLESAAIISSFLIGAMNNANN